MVFFIISRSHEGMVHMDTFTLSNLLEGRPQVIDNEKQKACYDTLDSLGIGYQRVEYNFFPSEPEHLRLIDQTLDVPGVKNLIFRTKNKSQFFFVILPRESRFDEKAFRSKFELPKITMAKGEDLSELLDTHAGAVSIMELVHDQNSMIRLFIEERVLEEKFFRFHPNENNSTLRISMEDFKNRLIPYLKHEITIL